MKKQMSLPEAVLRNAANLVSLRLLQEGARDRGLPLKYCKSTKHGDICVGRDTSDVLKGCEPEVMLSSPHNTYLNKVSFNPQGYVCLHLNRPVLFRECIKLTTEGPQASSTPTPAAAPPSVLLITHTSLPRGKGRPSISAAPAGSIAAGCSSREEAPHSATAELLLPEARVVLTAGLLRNVLQATGQPVYQSCSHLTEAEFTDSSAWHLFDPFAKSDVDRLLSCELEMDMFVDSLRALRVRGEAALVIDLNQHLRAAGMIGKGGYDANLERVEVCDAVGALSDAAAIAFKIAKLHHGLSSGGHHMIVHVVWQRSSFVIQQAMALAELSFRASGKAVRQYLLSLADVHCFTIDKERKQCSISQLLSARLQQMTSAHVVKYGAERARSAELLDLAGRMTEAAVKFELLSNDLKSAVKVELPSLLQSDTSGAGLNVRCSGTFVLYNYARLGTLFLHFSQACQQGTYPPLPAVEHVDFSLLNDELEWELLFHYVLQYPLVLRETAELKCSGVGIGLDVSLKKVAKFLTQLSHAFSSYYSRVKVLLPPEPHLLPLVQARLHLMAAIKTVMHHSLALMEIDPPDQL